MEDSAKKTLMIAVSIVCIVAAGFFIYRSIGGSSATSGSATAAGMRWVKCNNPKCDNEYEITAKEYTEFVNQNGGPRQFMMSGAVPMKCPKCNEASVFAAKKCEKCGKVFFPGSVEGKAEDTCPGCGYSPSTAPAPAPAPKT